jgi:hypothetical protein
MLNYEPTTVLWWRAVWYDHRNDEPFAVEIPRRPLVALAGSAHVIEGSGYACAVISVLILRRRMKKHTYLAARNFYDRVYLENGERRA